MLCVIREVFNDNSPTMANTLRPLLFPAFTFLVWAIAAASVAFWGLKLGSSSVQSGAAPVVSSGLQADTALVTRVLGATKGEAATAAVVPTSTRFVLMGMVAAGAQHGIALISVDNKPAKPVQVGGKLDEGIVLQSVAPRRATVGASMDSPASFVLELPGSRK